MSVRRRWVQAVCCFSLAMPIAHSQSAGTVQGVVLAPDGKPVSDAAVLFAELPTQTRSGTALAGGRVRTQSDGAFVIANLPAANYQLCVQAVEKGLLDPCVWSAKKPLASVTAGQTTTIQIRMTAGSLVRLRLDDPGAHLKGRENTAPGTGLVLVVHAPSGFAQTMRLASQDPSGKDFEVLLPTGIPLSLGILGDFFTIADSNGKGVGGAAGDLSVTIPPGVGNVPIKLTVTGHK